MNISTALFQDITAFLTPLPCFYDENSRRAFLLQAGLEEILEQVHFAGTPQTFIPLLLEFLKQYGNIGEQPALCRLLDSATEFVGADKRAQLAEFCERIQAERHAEQQADAEKYSHATPAQQAELERKMALEREAERQRSERAQQSQQRSIGIKPNVEKLFVDRETYLTQLTGAIADDAARLILIVGQGGMGKTALAAKFCDDLEKAGYKIPLLGGAIHQPTPALTPSPESGEGRGGVTIRAIVYISRAELQTFTIDHVLRKLAQSLDAEAAKRVAPILSDPRAGATVKTEALLDVLRDGLTLLVLDNFETLLTDGAICNPGIAAFLETACATQHGLNIIITSRYDVPLAAFESVRRLHLNTGLRLPDAVGLLRRLGKTVESVCAAPDAELEQLANAVFCVPMALKSLVGFLRSRPRVTVPHLLRDDGRFAEFKRHDVTAGMRKLIAEQYSLLNEHERLALQALAVFNAPVAPVAAQSLFPGLDADAVLETLAYRLFLAQHNRVTDEFDLHPSVREYAYEQISRQNRSAKAELLHSRAADFYAQMKKPEAEWKRLADVQPHLEEIAQRVAAGEYDRAAEVLDEIDFDYLQLWGYYHIVIALREQLRGKLTDNGLIQDNDGNLGLTYHQTGRVCEAIPLYEHALEISRSDGDKQGEGKRLNHLGAAYSDLGETRQAIDYYTQALAIAREIGDRHGEGNYLGNLGTAYSDLGETRQAIDYYTQALAIDREIGDRRGEGADLGNLGNAYLNLGETRQAIDFYTRALAIRREIGDRHGEGADLGNLGSAYLNVGETRQAIDYYTQALAIAREIGDRHGEGNYIGNLGNAYLNLGETRQAIDFHTQALTIHREIRNRHGEAYDLGNLGTAYLDRCVQEVTLIYFPQAIECHQQALEIHQQIQSSTYIPEEYKRLGIAVFFDGKNGEAASYFQHCLTACDAALANAQLYEVLYYRAFALLALQAVASVSPPADAPLATYQQALAVCSAAGVVNEQIHELERWQQICARVGLAAPLAADALALLREKIAN